MTAPTPTNNTSLPKRLADFATLPDALDYAAKGETGFNFYTARGELDHVMSFASLRADALVCAAHLIGGGLKPGDRVALLAETEPSFLVGFFGCQYAGIIPVPMPVPTAFGRRDAYLDQIRGQIRSSGARLVMASADFLTMAEEASAGLELILCGTLDQVLALPKADKVSGAGRPEDLCYVQYSSGSTRFPKGVVITHGNLMANCQAMNVGVENKVGERAVSWLPFYHDMGLVGFMLACLTSQTSVDYLRTENFARRPLTWLKILSENKGTMSYSPSFGYELCARRVTSPTAGSLDIDLSAWRVAGIGGEMIKPHAMHRFAEVFGPYGFRTEAFNASYGLAECVLGVSFSKPLTGMTLDHVSKQALGDEHRAVPVPDGSPDGRTFVLCGLIVGGHDIQIRSEDGAVLGDRDVGKVWVKGPSVMQGYYMDPEATAECLVDGWLDTGDLGYFVGDELVIVGRSKDMMIVNGRNYWPQDIEWTVEHMDGMRSGDAAAITLTDGNGDEQPVILVQCRPSDPEERMALADSIRGKVQEQVGLLCEVVLVPARSLPKTTSGKLARGKAKTNYLSGELAPLPAVGEP